MGFWIFEAIATFLESSVALSVVTETSGEKYVGRKCYLLHMACSAILTLIISLLNLVSIFSFITPIIAIAFIVFVSSKALSTGPLIIRITACFLAYTVMQTIDYIIAVIMGLLRNDPSGFFLSITTQGTDRFVYLAIDKVVELSIFFLLRGQLPKLLSLSGKKQVASMVLSVVSYSYMQFLFSSILSPVQSVVQTTVIFSWVFILLFILAMLAFFIALTRIEQDEQMKGILSAENAMMAENYKLLHEQQQTYAKRLHDFKHHLTAIEGLLSQDKKKEAENYLASVLERSFPESVSCHSGNDIIDAIINFKSEEAKNEGIHFHYVANVQDGVNIEPVDICGVLANQIDNAMDACKKMSDRTMRRISVEVRLAQDFLILRVINTVDHDPFSSDGRLTSKKKASDLPHGFGLKSINEVADRYNGAVRNEYKNGEFRSTVTLCQRPFDTQKHTI